MIPHGFKPMLAAQVDLEKIKYPVLVSPKLDGIRCVCFDGVAYSRSLKRIPNKWIQAWVKRFASYLDRADGELVVGPVAAKDVFQKTMSGVMAEDGEPDFIYYLFDLVAPGAFEDRMWNSADATVRIINRTHLVPQYECVDRAQLDVFETSLLTEGYEGVMIRDPKSPYKRGRSTVKEGYLLKLKRFEDAEGIIVGYDELEHNDNELRKDERGYSKRSSDKAGKRAGGTLGALVVESENWPDLIHVGSGFTDVQRADIWLHRSDYLSRIITFRFQRVGTVDLPRCPIFKGFRDARDSS